MQSTFVGLKPDEVEAMRRQDPAVAAIASQGARITFEWLRARWGVENKIHDTLRYGRAVLETTDQLDQYLWSYGQIVARQWREVPDLPTFDPRPVRLVDYGCGQGLAGLLLRERLGTGFAAILARIILIEASAVALVRAEAVYRALAPDAEIVCIRKSFDHVTAAHLGDETGRPTIHVFSNVLDIPGYDHVALFCKALGPGQHHVLALSHDREFNGGTDRLRRLHDLLNEPEHARRFIRPRSTLNQFKCSGKPYTAVAWFARFEVVNG